MKLVLIRKNAPTGKIAAKAQMKVGVQTKKLVSLLQLDEIAETLIQGYLLFQIQNIKIMKKNIKLVIQKIEQNDHQSLFGGFASIKGGFTQFATVTTGNNTRCTNTSTSCDGTNTYCTNNTTNCGPSYNTHCSNNSCLY